MTVGFQGLPIEKQRLAVMEFEEVSMRKEDWLYSLLDGEVYAQLNELGSYTLMKSEEY